MSFRSSLADRSRVGCEGDVEVATGRVLGSGPGLFGAGALKCLPELAVEPGAVGGLILSEFVADQVPGFGPEEYVQGGGGPFHVQSWWEQICLLEAAGQSCHVGQVALFP